MLPIGGCGAASFCACWSILFLSDLRFPVAPWRSIRPAPEPLVSHSLLPSQAERKPDHAAAPPGRKPFATCYVLSCCLNRERSVFSGDHPPAPGVAPRQLRGRARALAGPLSEAEVARPRHAARRRGAAAPRHHEPGARGLSASARAGGGRPEPQRPRSLLCRRRTRDALRADRRGPPPQGAEARRRGHAGRDPGGVYRSVRPTAGDHARGTRRPRAAGDHQSSLRAAGRAALLRRPLGRRDRRRLGRVAADGDPRLANGAHLALWRAPELTTARRRTCGVSTSWCWPPPPSTLRSRRTSCARPPPRRTSWRRCAAAWRPPPRCPKAFWRSPPPSCWRWRHASRLRRRRS